MREIKFRIIYKNKVQGYERLVKKPDGLVGWEWMWLELNPDKGERWTSGIVHDTKMEMIRNQFTGLKDKNGKEIYESDFVRVFNDGKEQGVYLVAWMQESCCFMMGRMLPDNSDADTMYFGNQFDYEYEIISNSYENNKEK